MSDGHSRSGLCSGRGGTTTCDASLLTWALSLPKNPLRGLGDAGQPPFWEISSVLALRCHTRCLGLIILQVFLFQQQQEVPPPQPADTKLFLPALFWITAAFLALSGNVELVFCGAIEVGCWKLVAPRF